MESIIIPFNKPFLTGKEVEYIEDAIHSGQIAGNGKYTKLCQQLFQEKYDFKKCLLTTSCTDALEMSAILANIMQSDEVIMPSYTFVSTANAFVLRGATIRFVDSREDHPGMDENKIEELINDRTKAIVVVHYAGVACDMDKIMSIASENGLLVIEDAAQAIDSYYLHGNKQLSPLGTIGHLSTFSFHETKNIISGEGGMLVINEEKFIERGEIIWEKGTNRSAFFRGEVDKYGWVDLGSSFLPSELISAFLFAQLEHLEEIQTKRIEIWNRYNEELHDVTEKLNIRRPKIPPYATNNGHMFYLVCEDNDQRTALIQHLKDYGIHTVFHYLSLHSSEFYKSKHNNRKLPNSDNYMNCLVRLPIFYTLKNKEQQFIINSINDFG